MIKNNDYFNKNKDWSIGSLVNIGFMKNLKIIAIKSVKDGLPDIYILKGGNDKQYEFIPHNGIHSLSN
jgi:hypothetical protein